MSVAVQCEHVSKKYQLGVTRTSILSSIRATASRIIQPNGFPKKGANDLWALKDVSFSLNKGRSLGLIGKNGAGKSTLLKLLSNITRPTSGHIQANGRLSALIELGSGFHPDLTGRENIFLNGTILGLTRNEIRNRFDEIVAFSELERFIDTPVKRYSSGMTVRLGFAVAACIEPDILLVDEVLAVGDASFRQKCMQRIQQLLKNGTSIIFVSHNLYMVQAVCPSSLYIVGGRVMYSGATTSAIDLYEQDLHAEQARKFETRENTSTQPSTEVQITHVEVVDASQHESKTEFQSDQPVKIKIHFQAFHSDDDVNAVVRLVRTDGVTACMMRSKNDQSSFQLKPGPGSITVELDPIQLAGGSYYVDARITNANDSVVLSTSWSDWFYVSGSGLSHETESGIFEPNRRWV